MAGTSAYGLWLMSDEGRFWTAVDMLSVLGPVMVIHTNGCCELAPPTFWQKVKRFFS